MAPMQQEDKVTVRRLARATGVIAGTLAALAAQIYLARMNVELAMAWRELFVTWTAQIKSAVAWWGVALIALIVGYVAAALTTFMMLHWWPLRLLRWICGTAIVVELAIIGHAAGAATSADAGLHVGASLAGAVLAMVTATIGAGFGARK
jgi:hypothetical protein